MSGQPKRLRADDGVHFTMRGYLKLANFVEQELRKDLTLAKEERNIPLAGSEDEQDKVLNPFTPAKPAAAPPIEEKPQAAEARSHVLNEGDLSRLLRLLVEDTQGHGHRADDRRAGQRGVRGRAGARVEGDIDEILVEGLRQSRAASQRLMGWVVAQRAHVERHHVAQ